MVRSAFRLALVPLLLGATLPAVEARIEEARRHLAAGKAEEAIQAFREAARIDPRSAVAHNALGSLLNRNGFYPEALAHAEAAVALEPGNARFRYNRGVVLAEHGRFAEAIADFDIAVGAHPDLAYAWLERGAARLALGQAAAARQDWERAQTADPQLVWTHWYPATLDILEGRYADAARGFDRVATAEPDFAPAALWRVIAHGRAGRPMETPVVGSTEWPAPVLDLFRGTLSAERLLALAAEDRASGDRRRVGEAHYFIAQRALIAGRREEAIAHLEQALAIPAPRHVWKLSAEAELRRLAASP